jgi:biotin transport system permease protein
MLTYEFGTTFAHRLDPRAKLAWQLGFAIAAFVRPTPQRLGVLSILAAGVLLAGRLSPITVIRSYWFVFVLLLLGPFSAAVSLRRPWVVPERAIPSLLAISRVVLVLCVGAVYVKTTPVRDTRAVIQRYIPGRLGQSLGVGVALTFRFLPVLRRDLASVRDAVRVRGGTHRSIIDRAKRIAVVGLARALDRADRLSLALQARCFAWNPTPPQLSWHWRDYPVVIAGTGLALSPLAVVV